MHNSGSTRRVLFLCTGNYYRSRYAEELFNHLAKDADLGWHAFSRGAAEKGSPQNVGSISVFAREALDLKGITLEGAERYPQPCTIGDFHAAQLVIALNELEHRPLIERRFAAVAHRVIYWHIHDVGVVHPTTALAMIDDRVRHLISNLS